jgi:hypothetical protein
MSIRAHIRQLFLFPKTSPERIFQNKPPYGKDSQRYPLHPTVFGFGWCVFPNKTVRNTVNLPGVEKATLPSALLIAFVIQTVMRSVCLRDQQCVSDSPPTATL